MIGRGLVSRMQVGAQIVARNPRQMLDLDDEIMRASFALFQSSRDLTLAQPDLRRCARLIAEQLDRQAKHLSRRRAARNSISEVRCVKHEVGSMRLCIGESTRKLDVQLMRKRIGSRA